MVTTRSLRRSSPAGSRSAGRHRWTIDLGFAWSESTPTACCNSKFRPSRGCRWSSRAPIPWATGCPCAGFLAKASRSPPGSVSTHPPEVTIGSGDSRAPRVLIDRGIPWRPDQPVPVIAPGGPRPTCLAPVLEGLKPLPGTDRIKSLPCRTGVGSGPGEVFSSSISYLGPGGRVSWRKSVISWRRWTLVLRPSLMEWERLGYDIMRNCLPWAMKAFTRASAP